MKKTLVPVIREILPDEFPFLDDMLYEAIFIPEGLTKLPRSIIKEPVINEYINDFGRKDDVCLVAEINGILIGAIWTRIFSENNKGYGWVDENTPELSMAIIDSFRNKGIGTILISKMLEKLKELRYKQLSLSVDLVNYAYEFYKKCGFSDYLLTDKSSIMIKKLI